MPSPVAISSVDGDSSCEASPNPVPKIAAKKRSKVKPARKAQPPKRPKSLLQHRADLEKKEQRRRKLKPKQKNEKQAIQQSEGWSSDSSFDSEQQRQQQPQAEHAIQDSESGLAPNTNAIALKKQSSEKDATKYKKLSRTAGSTKFSFEDDSTSDSDSDDSSQSSFGEARKPKRRKQKPPKKAQSSKKRAQSSSNSRKAQQTTTTTTTTTTEVLFPAHLLAEEVQNYVDSRKQDGQEALTEAEIQHLNKWVANAQEELEQQNQHVLENTRLVVDLRKVNRRRNQLQDQLLQQKKKTQALQQEAAVYQLEVVEAKNEHSTTDSAHQFLSALKGLALPN